jgi:hypothetical protein
METPFKLTPLVAEELIHLFNAYRPSAYRNTIIDIYLSYLNREHGHLPVNFDKMGHQMYLWLDFLRVAAEENGEKKNGVGWEK